MMRAKGEHVRDRRGARAMLAVVTTVGAFGALTVFGGLGGLLTAGPAAAQYEYGGKVTIFHRTGSKKKPMEMIVVNEDAVDMHLGHGDTIGPCPGG